MKFLSLLLLISVFTFNCQAQSEVVKDKVESKKKKKKRKKRVKLPKIDLAHWKVTTPAGDGKKPQEVSPPEIFDYATNKDLKPFMYNDSTRGAIVFYAFPSKATTRNTKYSRSELREQMVAGSNKVNWTFKQGGIMKGKLAIDEISRDKKGKYHKTIIMQIHGRLTNEQRDLIGADDNNAPPILKIYWKDGKIRVKTKILKNINANAEQILHEDAWGDDKGFTFKEKVGFKKFTIEVKVSEGKMVVVLNNNEYKVYENIHMKKWGVFENYFKAGNYFQTRDEGAFAKVRYYNLEVTH
ncbi:polysaccharide lyase family 7 protein [uncultured Lacinutrix sp.]|uniref:polysaccharide lyase family 7 protein n=1 Tax=uncultured Lacinutrix sp. TaxID=574032 RepID=UPI00262CFA8B|nr:polysaccharide lyase family 7 protein [uncultured Lacinutrix sp.]